MCAIFGALLKPDPENYPVVASRIEEILQRSRSRGRDGFGYLTRCRSGGSMYSKRDRFLGDVFETITPQVLPSWPLGGPRSDVVSVIANFRAEPTTEWIHSKRPTDQQPYTCGRWSVVHNGTIANDRDIRTNEVETTIDSAAIPEVLNQVERENPDLTAFEVFNRAISYLKGSFAIIAVRKNEPNRLFTACNYRPIWMEKTDQGVYFASSEEYFDSEANVKPIPAYSTGEYRILKGGLVSYRNQPLFQSLSNRRTLVVASGGLDSTVAAAMCVQRGDDVKLLHFTYGCRAEDREVKSVRDIAARLGCDVGIQPMNIYAPGDSRLLDKDAAVAGGEAGAEYAHEWVPARNLVMLSLAVAHAEAHGYDCIVLGNNMEEAGAYPDNEPEFIRRLNKVLPYAVADGKHVEIEMPLGDYMKHEIVKRGLEVDAPIDLTWSCYRNGEKHCGTCGPCFMRRIAFEINQADEVIDYETEEVPLAHC